MGVCKVFRRAKEKSLSAPLLLNQAALINSGGTHRLERPILIQTIPSAHWKSTKPFLPINFLSLIMLVVVRIMDWLAWNFIFVAPWCLLCMDLLWGLFRPLSTLILNLFQSFLKAVVRDPRSNTTYNQKGRGSYGEVFSSDDEVSHFRIPCISFRWVHSTNNRTPCLHKNFYRPD